MAGGLRDLRKALRIRRSCLRVLSFLHGAQQPGLLDNGSMLSSILISHIRGWRGPAAAADLPPGIHMYGIRSGNPYIWDPAGGKQLEAGLQRHGARTTKEDAQEAEGLRRTWSRAERLAFKGDRRAPVPKTAGLRY